MISNTIIEKLSVITEEEKEYLNGRNTINRNCYMEADVNLITGKKLLKPGKAITIRSHPRFIHFPEHYHDFVEMVYMCKGKTKHVINGNEIILKQGDLLLLSQYSHQEIFPADTDDIMVNFIIQPEFLSDTLNYLGNEDTPLKQFIVSCLCGENPSGYLFFKVSEITPIQNLIENLVYSLISEVSHRQSINSLTFSLLFMQLLEHTDKLSVSEKEQELTVDVLRYIECNYLNGSLNDLAKILHYDTAWLSREIKRRTGKTYTEHLQEKRLSQAAFLLKNTELNVSDIAISVGYENISYFHRIFFAKFGMSPRQYRNCK